MVGMFERVAGWRATSLILPTSIEVYELNGTIDDLLGLVRTLRAPDGCPWDRKQTLQSVHAYLLEEAHEAAHAIGEEDPEALRDELGDLLFQVAFVAVLAEERGDFVLADSIRSVHRKMVDRHPHVFGDANGDQPADAVEVARQWETRKASQKPENESLLHGVPTSLPALVAAYRLGQKTAGVGFDWPDMEPVFAKVREELAEVEAEIEAETGEETGEGIESDAQKSVETNRQRRVTAEIGDLLFAVVNLARHLDVDPEAALARTNSKFRRRFATVESELRLRGVSLGDASLEDMDSIWNDAKSREGS